MKCIRKLLTLSVLVCLPLIVYADTIDNSSAKPKDTQLRSRAVKELEATGASAIPRLTSLAKDNTKTDEERITALVLLGRLGKNASQQINPTGDAGTSVLGTLTESLKKEKNVKIREAAVIGLGHLGNTNAVTVLKESMNDKSINIRMRSAWALGKMGDASGSLKALAAVKGRDVTGKLLAVEALEAIGDASAVNELKKNLDSDDVWTRIYSQIGIKKLEALGRSGQARLEYLKEALYDKQFEINQWAAQELGKEILNSTPLKNTAREMLETVAARADIPGSYSAIKVLKKLGVE